MPSRHIEKTYAEDSFYHVFNRGVEKRNIFIEDIDYKYFLHLFERYLNNEKKLDKYYREAPSYSENIELVAYCLMPNHFHMLVYQKDKDAMQKFMRSIGTAYSMYFNKKYKRVGNLFQDRYKAVLINDNSYFAHISRYIHLNPLDIKKDFRLYPYSSLNAWIEDTQRPNWLKPGRVQCQFKNSADYLDFLESYKEIKADLDIIKKDLKE